MAASAPGDRDPPVEQHGEARDRDRGDRQEQQGVEERLAGEHHRRRDGLAQRERGARLLLAHEGAGETRRGREEEDDPEERGLERRPIVRRKAERADGVRDEGERGRREEEDGEQRDAPPQLLGDVLEEDGPHGPPDARRRAHRGARTAERSIR